MATQLLRPLPNRTAYGYVAPGADRMSLVLISDTPYLLDVRPLPQQALSAEVSFPQLIKASGEGMSSPSLSLSLPRSRLPDYLFVFVVPLLL